MVRYQSALDETCQALADPTRRALLSRLADTDSLTVSELAEPFAVTLPAVLKHLNVLSDAGLISRAKQGRTVTVLGPAGTEVPVTVPARSAAPGLPRYGATRSGSLRLGSSPLKLTLAAPAFSR